MEGWIGRWYIIDERVYCKKAHYMLEHETYGDETEHLIVTYDAENDRFDVALDEVWNGWDDFYDYMGW